MIAGLQYVPDYLAGAEHDALLATVSALDWQEAGGRRIQFYGHWYQAGRGGVYRVGDLPEWALGLARRLRDDGLMPYMADQLIVSEYQAGEGIRPHIDAPVFADVIVGVALGSACVMEFLRHGHDTETMLIEPRSAVVLSGDARHEWQHAIPARAADDWQGQRLRRSRRVSLTFRKMLQTDMSRREMLQVLGLLIAAGAVPAFAQAKPLRIGIIGTGRIGGALATHWTKAGHEVLMSSRNPDELRPLATSLGARARVGTPREAAAFGEVVLVSVPYGAMPEIGRDNATQLKGKVVLDTSNPVEDRDGPMAIEAQKKGAGVATAELLPGARVVRAFNTIPAASLANNANRRPERIAVPIGGDDAEALALAERLVRDAGFDPVVVGSLAQTRRFDLGQPLASGQFTAAELRKAIGS